MLKATTITGDTQRMHKSTTLDCVLQWTHKNLRLIQQTA